jgi:hypothetical protein
MKNNEMVFEMLYKVQFQVSIANFNGHIKQTRMPKSERVGSQFKSFQS